MARLTVSCLLAAALSLAVPATPSPAGQRPAAQAKLRAPDVIFLPTPPEVVAAMLTVADPLAATPSLTDTSAIEL